MKLLNDLIHGDTWFGNFYRKPWKWILNRIDNPFDNFKHWWRGNHTWLGMTFKCDAYMKNRPGSKWSIKYIKQRDE